MSLAQIKDQVAHLSVAEQRELIAFVFSIQPDEDEDSKDIMARKIDDEDPAHWMELDELRKRYSE